MVQYRGGVSSIMEAFRQKEDLGLEALGLDEGVVELRVSGHIIYIDRYVDRYLDRHIDS